MTRDSQDYIVRRKSARRLIVDGLLRNASHIGGFHSERRPVVSDLLLDLWRRIVWNIMLSVVTPVAKFHKGASLRPEPNMAMTSTRVAKFLCTGCAIG